MRGTREGAFFRLQDLPERGRIAGAARDRLRLRVIGRPDPCGKHTDGMSGTTSSTGKAVILSASTHPDHDADGPSVSAIPPARCASAPKPTGWPAWGQ